MRLRRISAIAVLACALALPMAAATQGDPAAVVRTFFQRYAEGDLQGASKLWVAGPPADTFTANHRKKQEKRCMRIAALSVDTDPADPAVVITSETFVMRSALPDSMEWTERSRSRFVLQLRGERWQIARWDSGDQLTADRIALASDEDARTRIVEASKEVQTTTLVRLLSRRAIERVNEGKLDRAGDLARIATRIATQLRDPAAMAAALSAGSVVLRYRNEFPASLMLAGEARELAEGGGDPEVLAQTLVRLARVREEVEGLPDLELLERAVALADQLQDLAIASLAATHLGRGYELRGRAREAIRFAELAGRYADESGDVAAQVSALTLLGTTSVWIGDLDRTERQHRRAARLALKAGFTGSIALTYSSLALDLARKGHNQEALETLAKGLRLVREPGARITLINQRIFLRLAWGRFDAAERDINMAVSLLPGGSAGHQDSYPLERAHIAAGRGRTAEALGRLDRIHPTDVQVDRRVRYLRADILQSLGRVKEARGLLEALVAETGTEPLSDPRLSLFGGAVHEDHRMLLRLLLGEGDTPAALIVSEQMKATELRSALLNGRVDPSYGMTAEEKEKERAFDAGIRDLNRRLIGGRLDASAAADVRARLSQARSELLEYRQSVYAGQPAMRVQHPGDLRLDTLPAHLDDVAIVSYVVDNGQTFAFVIGPKRHGHRSLVQRTIPIRIDTLKARVSRFATLVEQRNLRVPRLAADLYDLLIAPIESDLRFAKSVCFVPDSSLWAIPFHALGPSGGPPLVERVAVFYAPSISVLAAADARRGGAQSRPKLLAFANPTVTDETASLYRAFDRNASLGPLPETETEVRAIAGIYGAKSSRVYIGDQALEATFKREAPACDILHVATHGVTYDGAPMFSSLVLNASPHDEEDGVLEAREIATLTLHAGVAVLSACETGKAAWVSGEGVIGLSWAFLAAGCPTTVVSLWKAQSAATAVLMVEFHRQLAGGASSSEALRRAQLALRRDRRYRNPFYWAPFVVIGAP
jgi:CHAT domain-containing protein/tetratricopeptide (TPR) repeat protein